MTPATEYATLLSRLAVIPSILRTRQQDVARLEAHGGLNGEMASRIRERIEVVKRAIEDLERAL